MSNGVELGINHLKKSFGSLQVLRGIDLQIRQGEFVAIVGKSGCGKSTLLRHLAGLEETTEGEIIQDKKPIVGLNKKARVMFQDARLLPWKSVLENVGIGVGLKDDWKNRAAWALEQVSLQDREGEWPSILSGGQKQRVALARALAAQPQLLLLDEPLGALDALTRIEMQVLIEKLWQQESFTVLLVTHDVSEAIMLADRVILIEEGEIKMDLQVPIERPRSRENPVFNELESKVLNQVLGKQEAKRTKLKAAAGVS